MSTTFLQEHLDVNGACCRLPRESSCREVHDEAVGGRNWISTCNEDTCVTSRVTCSSVTSESSCDVLSDPDGKDTAVCVVSTSPISNRKKYCQACQMQRCRRKHRRLDLEDREHTERFCNEDRHIGDQQIVEGHQYLVSSSHKNPYYSLGGIKSGCYNNRGHVCKSRSQTSFLWQGDAIPRSSSCPALLLSANDRQLLSPDSLVFTDSPRQRTNWPASTTSDHFAGMYNIRDMNERDNLLNRNKSNRRQSVTDASDARAERLSIEESESDEGFESTNIVLPSPVGVQWMDSALIVWHAILLIISLLFLAVGIVLRVYFSSMVIQQVMNSANYILYTQFVKTDAIPKKLEFGSLTDVLGESLIVLSSLYIICCLIYMTFTLHKIPFTLPVMVMITSGIVLAEVNLINIYMSPVSAANEKAKRVLKKLIDTKYEVFSEEPFAVTYDIISIWGHCCGIVDQYDFQNVLLKHSVRMKESILQTPPTCCRPNIFQEGVDAVIDCAMKAEGIFQTGCYVEMYTWLKFYCNFYSVVVIIQLLDICIHIFMYKKHVRLLQAIV